MGLLCCPTLLSAQVSVTAIGNRVRQVNHEFTNISEAKQLGNGSILVLDELENLVFFIDSAWSRVQQVGRHGDGPTEYRIPVQIFVRPQGGALLKDRNGLRFSVLDDMGNVSGVLAIPGASSCELDRTRYALASAGSDTSGFLYAQADPARFLPEGGVEVADSAAIVRWRSPCVRDTVAYVPNPYGDDAVIFGTRRVTRRMGVSVEPFAPSTQWAVALDGRVAIITPDPYRVDLVRHLGPLVRGRTIAYSKLRVTEEHKADWRREKAMPAPALVIARNVPGTTRQMRKQKVAEPDNWPDFLPPFLDDAVRFDGEGRIWVQRTTAARAPATYDVIDRNAERIMTVVLEPESRVVGFGRAVVLVARVDGDGFEHLEMFTNPAAAAK